MFTIHERASTAVASWAVATMRARAVARCASVESDASAGRAVRRYSVSAARVVLCCSASSLRERSGEARSSRNRARAAESGRKGLCVAMCASVGGVQVRGVCAQCGRWVWCDSLQVVAGAMAAKKWEIVRVVRGSRRVCARALGDYEGLIGLRRRGTRTWRGVMSVDGGQGGAGRTRGQGMPHSGQVSGPRFGAAGSAGRVPVRS